MFISDLHTSSKSSRYIWSKWDYQYTYKIGKARFPWSMYELFREMWYDTNQSIIFETVYDFIRFHLKWLSTTT